MSLQLEDERELTQHSELSYESEKKVRIAYTRDFLLSLSELDVCKRLPSGFDQSILSEFDYASQDRYRVSGSFSSQSYRRNEYGSSPPTRGDISGFSRSNQERWDSRSSGRSDCDYDTLSDRDSDSGKRYANQTRKPWQSSEHDGLLGSGSFPRSSGCSSSSAPKFRPNQHYQLNRSNEPYHPPRPYKAVLHSRRDANDSFNDETFGSSECTDEDRAEEERKRRASFELMRKEQQKAFQERQKSNPGKLKDEFDICELLENPKEDKRLPTGTNEPVESFVQPVPNDDSYKSSIPPPASRPLVPPGFSGTMAEKNVGKKLFSEVGSELEDRPLLVKGSSVVNGAPNPQEQQQHLGRMDGSEEQISFPTDLPVTNKSERIAPMDISDKTSSMDSHVQKIPKLVEAIEASGNGKDIVLDAKDGVGDNLMDLSGRTQSTSILDKLFSKALSLNGSDVSSLIEDHDVKAVDTFSPHIPQAGQSSKFAQWFLEEEKKPNEDASSVEPNDLLSLIVGGEIGRRKVGDESPYQNYELSEKQMTMNLKTSIVEDADELLKNDKSEAVPAVFTCEDLEQSILSGLDENSMALRPVEKWGASEQSKMNVDDHASKHLLSLLKNGEGLNFVAPLTNFTNISPDKQISNGNTITPVQTTTRTPDTESASNSGKPLTLETLFGSAFMKELQSVGAAPLGQKGFVEPASADALNLHGSPFPIWDETLLSSAVDTSSSLKDHEPSMLSHGMTQNELVSKLGGFDRSADVHLPEENTLIGISGARKHQHFIPATQEMTADINEKLAALNSVFRDQRPPVEGQEGAPVHRGSYGTWYPDFQGQNPHIQSSSSQLQAPQVNHVASLFQPLDSHPSNINPHVKVVAPENPPRRDNPNHQVFPNMVRAPLNRPNGGSTGFDHTIHGPMFQQMHMPGNYPPTHMLQGFPRGAQPPPPPHANNSMMGYGQDPNPMQGFSFGQSQPNTGSLSYQQGAADLDGRTTNPEALQRLMGMELRLNPKQGHPFTATAQTRGNFGPELGMGFGYR